MSVTADIPQLRAELSRFTHFHEAAARLIVHGQCDAEEVRTKYVRGFTPVKGQDQRPPELVSVHKLSARWPTLPSSVTFTLGAMMEVVDEFCVVISAKDRERDEWREKYQGLVGAFKSMADMLEAEGAK